MLLSLFACITVYSPVLSSLIVSLKD
jgi:hypothetical protein